MKKGFILRTVTLLLTMTLLALTLTACSGPVPTPRAGKVVATAGGEDIYYDELYFLAKNHIEDMEKLKGEDYLQQEGAVAEVADFVWKNLVTRDHALISVGRDYGIDITEGEIAEEVEKHLDGLITDSFEGGYDEYVAVLDKQHMTDRYVRTYLAVENYLATAIVKEMMKRGSRDRRLFSESIFAFFRFYGWLKTLLTAEEQMLLAAGNSRQLAGKSVAMLLAGI